MNGQIIHHLKAHDYSVGSPDLGRPTLTVTRPEEIPAALAQGIAERRPVLIDIPAFQWRASLLAAVQKRKWLGKFAWWLFNFLATFLLTQWLLAQGLSVPAVPDWAKVNFVRQPDHKVSLSPLEE
jgi:hypothetical protein